MAELSILSSLQEINAAISMVDKVTFFFPVWHTLALQWAHSAQISNASPSFTIVCHVLHSWSCRCAETCALYCSDPRKAITLLRERGESTNEDKQDAAGPAYHHPDWVMDLGCVCAYVRVFVLFLFESSLMTHNTFIKSKEKNRADGKNQQQILKMPHQFKQNGRTQAAVVAPFISRYTEYTCQAYTQEHLDTHT